MGKYADIRNKRFGKLVVKELIGKNKHNKAMWLCVCDCGNNHVSTTSDLLSNKCMSCGCYKREKTIANNTTHNMSGTRLYCIWSNMLQRCYNVNHPQYKNYGARGIVVCDEWKNDFECFFDWSMSNGYDKRLTIDRIDNNGMYEPNNCRWITQHQQSFNRRTNRLLKHNGETRSVTEWCTILNLPPNTIFNRLYRGWDSERALTTPIKNNLNK